MQKRYTTTIRKNDEYAVFVNEHNLRLGDCIIRKKKDAPINHYGLFIGYYDDDFWVVENQINKGVRYVTLSDFFSEGLHFLKRIEKFEGFEYKRKIIFQKVEERLGKEYSLLTYNCESFVNDVRYGISRSLQVEKAFTTALTIITICLGIMIVNGLIQAKKKQ